MIDELWNFFAEDRQDVRADIVRSGTALVLRHAQISIRCLRRRNLALALVRGRLQWIQISDSPKAFIFIELFSEVLVFLHHS